MDETSPVVQGEQHLDNLKILTEGKNADENDCYSQDFCYFHVKKKTAQVCTGGEETHDKFRDCMWFCLPAGDMMQAKRNAN